MKECQHIVDNAAGLFALADEDPERVRALAHAEGCAQCRQALDEGRQLFEMLALAPAPPPSEEALARAAAAIHAEMDLEQAAIPDAAARPSWGSRMAMPLSVAASFALLVLWLRVSWADGRADAIAALMVVAALGLAALAARFSRPLLYGSFAASTVFAALTAQAHAAHGVANALQLSLTKCWLAEGIAAAIPLAVTALVLWKRPSARGPWQLATAAALGALAGQAAMHLACPNHALSHLLVAHTGGVMIAATVGMLLSLLPPLRARP